MKRHEERVNSGGGRSNNPSRRKPRKGAGEQGSRAKQGGKPQRQQRK
ncbi:hypothetical protein QW180_17230 [Vibrio sinaloensis]|nr:hypothetical protein [Vibrio sinaloensis]